MRTCLSGIIFFWIFLFETLWPRVADASDFQSPRTSALGGAGHANPFFTDAIYLNPSAISLIPVRAVSGSFLSRAENQGQTPFNISAQDGSRTYPFQFGGGYTRRENNSLIHFGMSKAVLDELSFGVGLKFNLPGDFGGSSSTDLSFSTTALISSWFRFSLIIDSFFAPDSDSNLNSELNFHKEYILGTKFNLFSRLQLYLDPHYLPDPAIGQDSWGYEAGMEYPFLEYFFLRAGLFKNSALSFTGQFGNGYGLGAGILTPYFSVDYAFSKMTAPVGSSVHIFGLTIYL